MHVGIRFEEAMRILIRAKRSIVRAELRLDRAAQLEGALLELAACIERCGGGRVTQQCERLIVQEGPIVQRRSIDTGQGSKQSIRSPVVGDEIVRSSLQDAPHVALPAEPRRLCKRVDLTRVNSSAPRMGKSGAILREGLDEAAIRGIDAVLRPQGIGGARQPRYEAGTRGFQFQYRRTITPVFHAPIVT